MVSSGRRDPPNGAALEDLSIGSTENFISDGRGERTSQSPVTQTALRNHWLTLTHPLEPPSFVRRYAKLRPRYRRPRVEDFPGNPRRPSLRTLRPTASRPQIPMARRGGPSPFAIYVGLAARRRVPSNRSAIPTCAAISMRIGFTHPTRAETTSRRMR
jgi:hypothetical protein